MHVLCPNCQQAITVPEESAGRTAQCPLCGGTFTAPTLFTPPSRPADPPAPAAGPGTPPRPEPYNIAPTTPPPAGPAAAPPPVGDRGRAAAPPPPAPAAAPPSTEPADGLPSRATLMIREPVVRGLALGSLAAAVILTFFPWDGAYPGGYGVYTQNAWQALFASFSYDLVGEKYLGAQPKIHDLIRASWWMLPYLLGLLAMVALAVIELVVPRLNRPLPEPIARLREQPPSTRLAILAGLAGLTLISLLAQSVSRFGLERAIAATVEGEPELQKLNDPSNTPEEQQRLNMLRAEKMGRFGVKHTLWLDLAVLAHILIVVSVGLEYWLYRRGDRPPPRVELRW
jgi:hypothetical protein